MKLKDYRDTIQDVTDIKSQVHEHIGKYIKCRVKEIFIRKFTGGKFNAPSLDASLSSQMERYEKDLLNSFNQCDDWQFEWDSITMIGTDTWGYGGSEDYDFQIEDVHFFFDAEIRETCIADVEKKFKDLAAHWKKNQKKHKAAKKTVKDTAEHAKYLELKAKYEG